MHVILKREPLFFLLCFQVLEKWWILHECILILWYGTLNALGGDVIYWQKRHHSENKASKTSYILENVITKWVGMAYFFSPLTRFGGCMTLRSNWISFWGKTWVRMDWCCSAGCVPEAVATTQLVYSCAFVHLAMCWNSVRVRGNSRRHIATINLFELIAACHLMVPKVLQLSRHSMSLGLIWKHCLRSSLRYSHLFVNALYLVLKMISYMRWMDAKQSINSRKKWCLSILFVILHQQDSSVSHQSSCLNQTL